MILCEVSGLSLKQALNLLKKVSLKLPVQTVFVNKLLC
jgi:hypothetical protein